MVQRRVSGFSIIELMITIAIVAILVALAFPSFEGSLRSNRVASTTNEMLASLSLARMEALRSPTGAEVCSSSDGTSCGGSWSDGWIVWVDDGDGIPAGANDRVLRHVQGKARLLVSATSPGGAAFASRIRFDNRGRADAHTRTIAIQPDTCPSGQELVREIEVSLTGQARTSKETCA